MRIGPLAVGGQAEAFDHLMLQAAQPGALRGQFALRVFGDHAPHGFLGLQEGDPVFGKFVAQILAQELGGLRRGVAAQRIERRAAFDQQPQRLGLALRLSPDRQNHVGIRRLADDARRHVEIVNRVLQPLPVDAVRVDAQHPPVPAVRTDLLSGRGVRFRVRRDGFDRHAAVRGAGAQLQARRPAAQQPVHRGRHVRVDRQPAAVADLDQHVEGRRGLAFLDGLLRAPAARLVVPERDGLHPAHQVGQRRVQHEVFQRAAVRGRNQPHTALGDRARGRGLGFGADLVHHDHLGHVVFDRFDHGAVLAVGRGDLHAPGAADGGVRNVAVARDFVRGVHDHDALAGFVGQHAGRLAQQRGLADPGRAEQQDALVRVPDEVLHDVHGAEDLAPDPAGQPDDAAGSVSQRGNAVQGTGNAGAVVVAERPDAVHHEGDRRRLGRLPVQRGGLGCVARFGRAAQIENDFEQVVQAAFPDDGVPQCGRKHVEQQIDVVHRPHAG